MKLKLIPGCIMFFAPAIISAQNKKVVEINSNTAELQVAFNPEKKIALKTVCWHDISQKAFANASDKGWLEPGGKRKRMNVDVSVSWQINNWFYSDFELNYTKEGLLAVLFYDNYFSLESSAALNGGFSAFLRNGFSVSFMYGITGDYTVFQFDKASVLKRFIKEVELGYTWKKLELTISAENIFNSEIREEQFLTQSNLQYENESVTTIHHTPGSPLFIKSSLILRF